MIYKLQQTVKIFIINCYHSSPLARKLIRNTTGIARLQFIKKNHTKNDYKL
jgi:hypothetical protein